MVAQICSTGIVIAVTGSSQPSTSAYYAADFDAEFGADPAGSESGRHRASQTESVELELTQVRARLDKLRQRMRSALGPKVTVGLGGAAVLLIALAVLSLVSFVNGDSGLGMLLGGLFVAGVPLTGAAAIRAAQPWWRLSHEAALLRQRENELHARWDRAVVADEGPRGEPAHSEDDSERFWRAARSAGRPEPSPYGASSYPISSDSGYGLPGQSRTASSDPRSGSIGPSVPIDVTPDSDELHLVEYSALSPSSHVLAQAMRDTLGTPPPSKPSPEADDLDSSRQLLNAMVPQQPKKRRTARTEPSWWSPTGLHPSATKHATPAESQERPVGAWGALLALGALMTLFAVGLIAGVLTSA